MSECIDLAFHRRSVDHHGLVRFLSVSIVAVCLTVVVGCANTTMTVSQPVTNRPGQVSVSIDDQTNGRMTFGDRKILAAAVGTRIQKGGINAISSGDESIPSLVGSISFYGPGSPALRSLTLPGYGIGEGYLEGSWTLSDPTGAILGRCHVTAKTNGALGASWSDVLDDVGDLLSDFLKGKK